MSIATANLQVAKNVTTNELSNWQRYRYLKDERGHFKNPFDRGVRQNCLDNCNPGTTEGAPVVEAGDRAESMSLLKMEQGQLFHQARLDVNTAASGGPGS